MIAFVGDVHERRDDFARAVEALPRSVRAVVQVGDLPLYPHVERRRPWRPLDVPVYFIDGNHHFFPETRALTAPTELRPGLVYVPRGTVLVLEGLRVGFLGGADSIIDRAQRRPGVDWWEDEAVRPGDVQRLLTSAAEAGGLDLLTCHTPPARVTEALVGGAPHPSARLVEEAWVALGCPPLVAGHMHRPFRVGVVEVLDELGLTFRRGPDESSAVVP